jgi:hypothetical protein
VRRIPLAILPLSLRQKNEDISQADQVVEAVMLMKMVTKYQLEERVLEDIVGRRR